MAEGTGSQARFRLRERALEWRPIEGEVVAIDFDRFVYLRVNRSGAVLWSALGAGASQDELVQRLQDRFGIPPEAAAADVDRFLAALRAGALLAE